MAGVLQHLRSSTLDKRPNPASMADGQVAVNYASASPGMFFKNAAGNLVKVGPVHVGTTAPNVTPAVGGTAGNSVGEQWLDTSSSRYVFKIWDGSAWRSEDGEFVKTSGDTMTGALGIIAGSAASPSLFISGDSNTGIYSPGADQVAISTNGARRLYIDSTGALTVDTGDAFIYGMRVGRGVGAQASNTVVGATGALGSNTSGTNNVALGEQCLAANTSGNSNTAVGSRCLTSNISGGNNIAIGVLTLNANTTGANNIGLGYQALTSNTGTNNLAFGFQSGYNLTTGSNNTIIGAITGTAGLSDTVIIGAGTTERLRIDSSGRVGIGTSSPTVALDVVGGIKASTTLEVTGTTTLNAVTQQGVITGTPYNTGVVITYPTPTADSKSILLGNNSTGARWGVESSTGGSILTGTSAYSVVLGTNEAYPVQIVSSNAVRGTFSSTGLAVTGAISATSAAATAPFIATIGASEAARIDSSGRLLVGTSSPVSTLYDSGLLQVTSSSGGTAVFGRQDATIISGNAIGTLSWWSNQGGGYEESAKIAAVADGTHANGDKPTRLVFSTTADGASSPTERMRIANTGALGLSGANYGTSGQVLVSNGSTAAPTWQSVSPTSVFGWNHTNDAYGLYLPGTSITTGSLSGTVDIDVQSRIRRCVINDAGVVQYYLDADNSANKSGDWLRIVETQALDVAYTGTHSESTNSLLRVGVPAWAAGTFTLGQRVTHSGSLWECVAASTTATPAAGAVASDLTGTDGQVMIEVPAFSVRYGFASGVHTREIRLGCNASLIAQGFQPHTAFVKTDGTYKTAFYIGAYQVTGTSPATTVSGANNRVSMTRSTQRAASVARGTGWHIFSYLELAAIQTLMVTEFRDMNTQKVIGNGAQEGSVFVVSTGLSNGQGNKSANAYTSGGSTSDYVSYRGLENIYGRAWQWVDGFNVYERVVYLTNNQSVFADNTSNGYTFYAQVPSGSASYQKEIFPLPDVFLPSVVTGGSSTTYLGDALWTSTGWREAYVGGYSFDGAQVGAFGLILYHGSGYANADISSRLSYAQN